MDKGAKFLSELVLNRTYAGLKADGTKEGWPEIVERVLHHHKTRYPHLRAAIDQTCAAALMDKKVVPAMRWLQFAGEGIRRSEVRGYNCSFTTLTSFNDFAEIFYILMCGTGVGYSVQARHVTHLPTISQGDKAHFAVDDTKESWADSVRELLLNPQTEFDYSRIRAAGSALSTGGTASGPDPLILLHNRMRTTLAKARNRKLLPIEVHDMVCQIADSVVVGGVRRAALICLFDWSDTEMLTCKSGKWWETAPWRARANNSAVIHRQDAQARFAFDQVLDSCFAASSGEPGVYWTNDCDLGANPCVEIALRARQFCNLTEVNLSACHNEADVRSAVTAAAVLGTLQASYTQFPYLSPQWEENCRAEALLGISLTGQARAWGLLQEARLLQLWAQQAVETNATWAQALGIRRAARLTCTKPSGTASAFLGTTSGIHAAHSHHYLRRVRLEAKHPLSVHLKKKLPTAFFEPDGQAPDNVVISVPIAMPDAIHREDEHPLQLLERMRHVSLNWIRPGHRTGQNTHNVSLTVSYRCSEAQEIKNWMWENRDCYAGISLFPFSDHIYQQAPFKALTPSEYHELIDLFPSIDFSTVQYTADDTAHRESEVSCSGQACEWA